MLIFFAFLVLLTLIATLVVLACFLVLFKGAPYVATSNERVKKMIALASPLSGERAADLGSGDGRLVVALTESGAEAHGFEVNPILVWRSRRIIRQAGLSKRAKIFRKSFWRHNFSEYDIITVYGITYIMAMLEKKLRKELRPGSRVVSNGFAFPDWPIVKRDGNIYFYVV